MPRAAIAGAWRADRVLAILAPRPPWQYSLPVAEHRTIFGMRERTTGANQPFGGLRLRRQVGKTYRRKLRRGLLGDRGAGDQRTGYAESKP